MVYRPRSAYVEYFVVPDGLNTIVADKIRVAASYRGVVMITSEDVDVLGVVNGHRFESKPHVACLNDIIVPHGFVVDYTSEGCDFGVYVAYECYLSIQLD